MPSACGVTWSGTSSGKLDRSSIPDPPDHKSHFLNAGETKGDSSFPVVDGNGNLRAGNVHSAWNLRTQGEGVSESCLRKLDAAFDDRVLPDSAYEDSVSLADMEFNGEFGMNLEFSTLPASALAEGFNRHGVRTNDDGSLDVRFNAMEPGVRRGVEITDQFLSNVTRHEYGRIPVQLDHSKDQLSNAGFIEPGNIKFGGDFLQIQAHIPNTGSSVRDDIIADFSHDPPQITDISVAFYPQTVEVEPPSERGENPRFTDAKIREFSLTPFPAGYDNGGLTPEFSDAIDKALEVPEAPEESGTVPEPESQLITRKRILRAFKYD